jgi:hypothetical protein
MEKYILSSRHQVQNSAFSRKIMPKVFWYSARPMPVHFQKKGITVVTDSEST